MCGIYYSTVPGEYSLENISKRGPDSNRELYNNLGFFKHFSLKTKDASAQPFQGKHGTLLFNGSVYNAENDTYHIGSGLSNNIKHCVDFIRTLRGEYSLLWVTDDFYMIATDPFKNRSIWISFDEDKNIEVASYPDVFRNNDRTCWPVPANKICFFSKGSTKIQMYENAVWNLEQKHQSYDRLCEAFEKAVMDRTSSKTCLPLSSGYDTGCIGAIWKKNQIDLPIVTDISTENPIVMKYRIKLHSKCFKVGKEIDGEDIDKIIAINDSRSLHGVRAPHLVNLCKMMRKNNLVSFMSGDGGDEIYSDYGFNGQQVTKESYFGGCFPDDLGLVWPPPSLHIVLDYTHRLDLISGFFGTEARTPFLDKAVVQRWLNLKTDLKNKGYKQWMADIMTQSKYPFMKNQKIAYAKTSIKIK